MIKIVSKTRKLCGEITIPADKSISHRAVMFSSIAKGKSVISNFSSGADCHSTLNLFKQLGVKAELLNNKTIQIESVPLYMFFIVKKFNADIKTKNDKMIWVIVATIIITPIIISAVV